MSSDIKRGRGRPRVESNNPSTLRSRKARALAKIEPEDDPGHSCRVRLPNSTIDIITLIMEPEQDRGELGRLVDREFDAHFEQTLLEFVLDAVEAKLDKRRR